MKLWIESFTKVLVEMCDEFICSDSGVGLCEDDRKLLESLGSKTIRKSDKSSAGEAQEVMDNNNNAEETNRNIDKDQGSQYLENRHLPALTTHRQMLGERCKWENITLLFFNSHFTRD